MESEKSNKKLIIFSITAVLFIAGAVGGYFIYDRVLKDNGEVTENGNNNNINDNESSDSETNNNGDSTELSCEFNNENSHSGLITEKDSRVFFCLDHFEIRTVLPQINLDLPRIISLNSDIERRFLATADEIERYYDHCIIGIIFDYKDFLNGNILSFILIENDVQCTYGAETVESFNINVNTGQILTQNELLVSRGLSQNEFRNRLDRAIDNYFINNPSYWGDEDAEYIKSQTKNNLNHNNLNIFINENNNLAVPVMIDVFFGPPWPHIIEVI